MKYTMKLYDKLNDPDRGPWLRSRYEAAAYDEEGRVVATLYTDEISLVNEMGNRLAEQSGQPVVMQPHAFNAVTKLYYNTTSGRGLTYQPRSRQEA